MTVPSFHIRLKNRQPLVGLNGVVSLIIPTIRRQRQKNQVQGQRLGRGLCQERALCKSTKSPHKEPSVEASVYKLSTWEAETGESGAV